MFYLVPLRMLELMAGALLTVAAIPALHTQWLRDLASATGLNRVCRESLPSISSRKPARNTGSG